MIQASWSWKTNLGGVKMSAAVDHQVLIEQERAMYAPFFGSLGVSAAMMFTAAGSAYGTAKSGTGIASMSVTRPDLVMKAIIPVVMAGKPPKIFLE